MPTYSELPYDILHQLCTLIREIDFNTLKVFSQVDKRTHSAAVHILFHSIGFRQRCGETDTPWKGVQEVADAILGDKKALAAIRRIDLEPWVYKPKQFPVPNGLYNIIRACKGLRELRLMLQPEYREQTCNSLMGSSARKKQDDNDRPVFLSLESLTVPSPAWLQLSPLFPNLRSLEIDDEDDWPGESPVLLLDYKSLAKAHPRLNKLHTPEQGVSLVVEEIFKYIPDIEDLGLFGPLSDQSGDCILDHLPSYTQLVKLTALSLADKTSLSLGFKVPRCILGVQGIERVRKDRAKALARLTDGVERILIQGRANRGTCVLKQLTVGHWKRDYKTVYVKDDDGKLKEVM